ncbi:Uma2 family endonuclease [Sphingomonas yabuuchiae]|uniref:Uma2 family endonuclease n=1 Tax=Sphingomonas yabuuchiae TaxID=172044 RepID=A0AA41A3D9_9SPHN|nr:Uma2 family endonuclease [Sphingomonas yabuuchiae]MBN3559658.1 Uma2 family endonuclease [Sphingomonas yabuuchiae]
MNQLARLSSDTRARFTAPEFLHMVESGAFEGMKVELIDGELERMNPPMNGHSAAQANVVFYLAQKLGLAVVRAETGLVLNDSTVVACDAALLRQPLVENRFLTPYDVQLVIEIAQTTQSRDMGLKRMLYAQAGIPTYWVIDGVRRVVHVYADPVEGDYCSVHTVRFGEALAVPGSDAAITLD